MKKRIISGIMAAAMVISGISMPAIVQENTVSAAYRDSDGSYHFWDTNPSSEAKRPASEKNDPNWTLVWSDEFNGTSLDTNVWEIEENGWGYNHELQYYSKDNVKVTGGNLVLTAEKLTTPAVWQVGTRYVKSIDEDYNCTYTNYKSQAKKYYYRSGRINSNPTGKAGKSFGLGRVEARIKFPDFMGAFPAYWFMTNENGGSTRGEIDVIEKINRENAVHGTAHWDLDKGDEKRFSSTSVYNLPDGSNIADWHLFAMERDETKIVYYIDDIPFNTIYVTEANMDELLDNMYAILNLAIGGDMTYDYENDTAVTIEDSAFPQQMLVDYIRYYTKTSTEPAKVVKKDVLDTYEGSWTPIIGSGGSSGTITSTPNKPQDGFDANITSGGADFWNAAAEINKLHLVPGGTYEFTYTLETSDDYEMVLVIVEERNSANQRTGVLAEKEIYQAANNPTTYTTRFTVPIDYTDDVALYFGMGGNNIVREVKVTDVSLITYEEYDPAGGGSTTTEIVEKDYLDSYDGAWVLDIASWANATGTTVNKPTVGEGFEMHINNGGDSGTWGIQANAYDLQLERDKQYTYTCTIVADKDIQVVNQINGYTSAGYADWIEGAETTLNLKAGVPQEVTLTFSVPSSVTNPLQLSFGMGGTSNVNITVTDVSITSLEEEEIEVPPVADAKRQIYYSEVGKNIELKVPANWKYKYTYFPSAGNSNIYDYEKMTLSSVAVMQQSTNGGTLSTITNNTDKMNFVSANTGQDDYKIELKYKDGLNHEVVSAQETADITIYNFILGKKLYVLDYGLPVELTESGGSNDIFAMSALDIIAADDLTNGYGVTAQKIGVKKGKNDTLTYDKSTFGEMSTFDCSQGTVTSNFINGGAKDSIRYTPSKFMDHIDTFYYGMQVFKEGYPKNGVAIDATNATPVMTGQVDVMPASVVYYEDNFAEVVDGMDTTKYLEQIGTPVDDPQSNENESPYGYDKVYADDNQDGNGSSTLLTNESGSVVFTFTGTGFDIIGRTTGDSGTLNCVFDKLKDDGTVEKKDFRIVNVFFENGDLHQIPVISIKDLEYGTYRVTLKVTKAKNGNTKFYFDGVRIYKPAYENADVTGNYDTSEDGERIENVHDMLVGDGNVTQSMVTDTDGSTYVVDINASNRKAVLVSVPDGQKPILAGYTRTEDIRDFYGGDKEGVDDKGLYTDSLLNYIATGPNNEVYLTTGNAIAFCVDITNQKLEETASGNSNSCEPMIHVEAKKVVFNSQQSNASVGLRTIALNKGNYVKRDIATDSEGHTAIDTKTAMYYNIPIDANNCIKISNTKYLVIIEGVSSNDTYVSISNIKFNGCTISAPTTNDVIGTASEQHITLNTGNQLEYSDVKITNIVVSGNQFIDKDATVTITVDRAVDELKFDAVFASAIVNSGNDFVNEYIDGESNRWQYVEGSRSADGRTYTYTIHNPSDFVKMQLTLTPKIGDNKSRYSTSTTYNVWYEGKEPDVE